MSSRKSIWLALFAIVSLITLWLSIQSGSISQGDGKKGSDPATEDSRNRRAAPNTEIRRSENDNGAIKHAASSEVVLPPENAPLAETLKELVRLSNSGSSAASMRLFGDLRKCNLRVGALSVLNGVYYHRPGQTDSEYA